MRPGVRGASSWAYEMAINPRQPNGPNGRWP